MTSNSLEVEYSSYTVAEKQQRKSHKGSGLRVWRKV